MAASIDRRAFLKRAGAATAAAMAGPLVVTSRGAAQTDRLVVAVGQWGIETPCAWRSSQSEKSLWECVYDSLIVRDPKTFAIRPGLATEWKPSNEMRTWTFKLRREILDVAVQRHPDRNLVPVGIEDAGLMVRVDASKELVIERHARELPARQQV